MAAREKITSDGVITSAKDLGSGKGRDQATAIQQSRDNLKKYSVSKDSIVKKD